MPELDNPTLADLGDVQAKVQEVVAQADQTARASERAAQEGDLLYETDIQGMPMRRFKQKSLVNYQGRPLPERITVWRTRPLGQEASIPTAMLGKMLGKRHADGTAVFLTKKPDVAIPTPIKQTCDICLARGVRKRFLSLTQYEIHMGAFHEREWAVVQREQDRRERREERDALLTVLRRQSPQPTAAAVPQKKRRRRRENA